MTRRCSHCSNNGHNSRTCPNRGVKIFGVRFDGGSSIRKSASMGSLSHYGGGGLAAAVEGGDDREKDGYASEDFMKGRERKKGVAWTQEEHKMFLLGLRQLGKGDWRGIAHKYVVSRTATQVASHAQKYFIRQNHANKRKRRSSLFDMMPEELGDAQSLPLCNQEPEAENINPVPSPPPIEAEHESMNSNSSNPVLGYPPIDVQPFPSDISKNITKPETLLYPCAMMYPPYPPFFPFSYPYLPCYETDAMATSKTHSVVKPTAVHSTSPINVDELVGMSQLCLGEAVGESSSSSMPINLLGGGLGRHSAFRTNNLATGSSRMNLSSSPPIHAM